MPTRCPDASSLRKRYGGGIRRAIRIALLALGFATAGRADPSAPDSLELVVLHVNDTHGQLLPFRGPEGASVGGMARLATLVGRIRAENPGRVLLLHAGDILSRGGPVTVHYGGEADLLAMESAGFDALCPGNGEFYFGLENLMRQTSLVRFPVLVANIVYRNTGGSIFPPYEIRDLSGLRVAILGLGTFHTQRPESGSLALRNPIDVARVLAPRLKGRSDLLIALTHIGIREDSLLAVRVPEIDLIVGGHSHTRMEAPTRIARASGGGEVTVSQAGDLGRLLGRIRVPLRREGGRYRVGRVEEDWLPVDESLPEAPRVAELLDRYAAPLEARVCTSEVAIAHSASDESPMGRLVAEALRAVVGTEVALLDRGSVRTGLAAGPVTVADLCRVHPWRNRVFRATMTGAQIARALGEGGIVTAGCRFRTTGRGIEGLEIGGVPADPARAYSAAVGEYFAFYSKAMKKVRVDDTGRRLNDLLYQHLRRQAVIRAIPPPEKGSE